MDSRNVFVFSQSFLVSGKRKESNLSLTCKRNNQSDRLVDDVSSKQQTSSEGLKDGPTSSNFQRCSSSEMEKFLEKFKNPKLVRRPSSNRTCKRSVTKDSKNNGGKSEKSLGDISSDFIQPYPPASYISIESDISKEAGNEKGEEISTTKCFDNSACVPEGNGKTSQGETAITDQTQSEVSESSILLCPICWKPFDSKDAQTMHMKACATKHNVSMKQLLELLELIQKQEEERKALGIPLLPPRIPKKVKKDPVTSSMRPKTKLDGNIQLGMALSVSLQEAEQQKERDHLLEAGLFEEVKEKGLLPDQEVGDENPLPPAPIFLNVGKKGSNTGIGAPRARKKFSKFGGRIPTLLKRTPEDREKLITEKVAIILVGDEQLNTILPADDKENSPEWEIKSKMLNKYMDKEQIFWKMASFSPSSSSKDHFYVDSLSDFISPCKVAAGSKLKHLSQIPGRNTSPKLQDKDPSVELPGFRKFEEDMLSSYLSKDIKLDSSCNDEKKEAKRSLFAESPLISKKNTLSRDWIMLLGNPEMSDVKVYTKGERVIPAHKLVFFARCPLIMKDLVEEEARGKKACMLVWVEISYGAAFLFLKYIYGGVFSKLEAKHEKVLEDLNLLAERYEVGDLMALLKRVDFPKEEYADSLQSVDREVDNSMTCGEVAVEEDESRQAKIDKDSIIKDRDISICEQMNSAQASPVRMEERVIIICDGKDDSARIEDSDPCHRSESGVITNNDDVRMNSPIVSDLGRNSPDIFQMTEVAESPKSVELIEENDPPVTQESSQDSRESIEYLVSLMEKDSSAHKASNCDPEDGDKENSQEHFCVNSYVSESPSLVLKSRIGSDLDDTVPPETPDLGKVAKYMLTSSTPIVLQTNIFGETSNPANKNEAALTIEVKRKLQSLDKSDLVSPSPKKIRIEEEEDGKESNDCETEVVDLTLSGSDTEEVAGRTSMNNSNLSTLPPAVNNMEEFTPSKEVLPLSPAASPCGGYISNVWDDFDYVSDVPKVDFNDSISASQKTLTNEKKGIEGGCTKDFVTDKTYTNEIPELGSPQVDDSIILLDEDNEPAKDVSSPIDAARDSLREKEKHVSPSHSITDSQDKEEDITEKLLDASLSQINQSVFWRDENEPMEEVEESAAPCHTPVRSDLKGVGSNNGTPETPLYTKKANVTPLADYSAMKTPWLHKELDRYGIKHLKRNQAKQLLRHIYNELHPVLSDENQSKSSDSALREKDKIPITKEKDVPGKNVLEKKKITFESLDSSPEDESSSSDESSGNNSDFVVLEESIHESQFESPVKSQALSQKGPYVDIPTAMKKLIESDAAFHKKILLYEPIWLTDIKTSLKAHGAKFNVKQLMDYLDEQCITFRMEQGNRQRRRKTKKTFSLSQPCNKRRKNKETISCSQPS